MSEVIPNLPFEEYAARPGINASVLKIVHRQSLLHAKAYRDGSYREESDELDFGTCFHSLALEGRQDFVLIPTTYVNEKKEEKPWNWNAKVCQAWGAEQGDKIPLKEDEAVAVVSMANSIVEELGGMLKGQREVSLFATMKGHPVKCRIDFLPDDESLPIIDLKSCKSAEPAKFLRQSIDLGYLIQAAFALDVAKECGIKRDRFDLLAVESEAPHGVCRLRFRDQAISLLRVGRRHYRTAFDDLTKAIETNQWDSYGEHPAEDFTPPWMKEELDRTA